MGLHVWLITSRHTLPAPCASRGRAARRRKDGWGVAGSAASERHMQAHAARALRRRRGAGKSWGVAGSAATSAALQAAGVQAMARSTRAARHCATPRGLAAHPPRTQPHLPVPPAPCPRRPPAVGPTSTQRTQSHTDSRVRLPPTHLVDVGVVDLVDKADGGGLVGVSLRQLHMHPPHPALVGTCGVGAGARCGRPGVGKGSSGGSGGSAARLRRGWTSGCGGSMRSMRAGWVM